MPLVLSVAGEKMDINPDLIRRSKLAQFWFCCLSFICRCFRRQKLHKQTQKTTSNKWDQTNNPVSRIDSEKQPSFLKNFSTLGGVSQKLRF